MEKLLCVMNQNCFSLTYFTIHITELKTESKNFQRICLELFYVAAYMLITDIF